MRMSDWSSDVCSSDLGNHLRRRREIRREKRALGFLVIHLLEGVVLADVTRTGCGRSCIDCLEPAFEVRERREWIFGVLPHARSAVEPAPGGDVGDGVGFADKIGRATCRERVCQYV